MAALAPHKMEYENAEYTLNDDQRELAMETYDSSQAPRFRRLLTQRGAELRAILRAAGRLPDEAAEAESHDVTDFKDVATEQSLATVADAKVDHAAHELEQVLTALRRLDDPTPDHPSDYGQCLDCGEAIDLRRLAALPATPYCTACQTIHEHERQPALRR